MWKVRKQDTGKVYAAPDLRTLQGWCRDGRIVEADAVSSDDDPTWRQAGSVFDLAAHFRSLHVRAEAGDQERREPNAPRLRPRGSIRRTRAAAAGAAAAADADNIDMDLTSMMDMAFILVVLLMVISSPAFQHGMPVNVPEASQAGKVEKTDVEVTVAKDGQIAVNEKKLSGVADLPEELKARIPDIKSGQAKLILNADGDVSHRRVIEVMDTIRSCGIRDISVATKPKHER